MAKLELNRFEEGKKFLAKAQNFLSAIFDFFFVKNVKKSVKIGKVYTNKNPKIELM